MYISQAYLLQYLFETVRHTQTHTTTPAFPTSSAKTCHSKITAIMAGNIVLQNQEYFK